MIKIFASVMLICFITHTKAQINPHIPDLTYRDSISIISNKIRVDYRNPGLFLTRGGYKLFVGDFWGAIDDFNETLKYLPNNQTAIMCRGLAYADLNLFVEAERDLSTAIQLNPDDYYAKYRRGNMRIEAGDVEGAYWDYSQCTMYLIATKDDDSTLSLAYLQRGLLFINYKNNKEYGCKDLSKAGELGLPAAYDHIRVKCN